MRTGKPRNRDHVAIRTDEVLRQSIRNGQLRWSRKAIERHLRDAIAADSDDAASAGHAEIVATEPLPFPLERLEKMTCQHSS